MGFLENYAKYAGGNEAPPQYHKWSAIATLSSFVSRRVWIDQGIFTIYPNMYIVLVGSPGGGKTTAMSIGKKMVRALEIKLAATSITKEALTKMMAEECKQTIPYGEDFLEYYHLSVFATELTHFLGNNAIGMIDFLTTIYDEDVYEVRTKNKGTDVLRGPYLTMLGCMTPDLTNSYLKQNIISGGFARRAIFVLAHSRGEPVPFPTITPEMATAWDACIEWGRELQDVVGQFVWLPETRQWYADWYRKLRKSVGDCDDPMTAGYYESKHIQLLKIGMLVALSDSLELKLTPQHLHTALKLLEEAEKNLSQVFEGTGRNEEATVAAKIIHHLEASKKPISLKRIYAQFYRDADRQELDRIIHHLTVTGRISKTENSDVTYITLQKGN